ncbi:MAG: hypothetical protein ACOY0T_20350 [Myxococcota bacterium]
MNESEVPQIVQGLAFFPDEQELDSRQSATAHVGTRKHDFKCDTNSWF